MAKDSFDIAEEPKRKYRNFRLGVDPELDAVLEECRLSIPAHMRPNQSEHMRKILWKHVGK